MTKPKYFSMILAATMLIVAIFSTFSAIVKAEQVFGEFSATGAAQVHAATQSASNSAGIASIESDPARLSAPGYVTVTIKLRNTYGSIGGNSIGGNSIDNNSIGGADDDGFEVLSNDSPVIQPIATRPPFSINPPQTNTPDEVFDPITPPPTPVKPETPTYNPIIPIVSMPPAPQAGRFTHINITSPYGVGFATSDVNPGSVGVFKASMMLYDSMIGQPLSFKISWYDTAANNTYSQNLDLLIQRSDTAYLRLDRTVSTTRAATGEEVQITYAVINTGSRRLTNITIVDDKITGSKEITEPFSLSSGERKEIVYTYTMKSSSVSSKPVATFTPAGSSNVLSVTVSKITIGLINAQITKNINVGSPTPEGVPVTLFMTNNGSQNLSNLSVKDDLGNSISSGFSLAIGESKIIDHFVTNPDSVRNVVFYITGVYDSNKEFSDHTSSFIVRPYINPALLGLRFRAEVHKQLDSNNSIGIEFTVENTGRLPYTNVALTEAQLGYTLHEIIMLAPSSDPVTFYIDLTLDEPRELAFVLTAYDQSGNPHTFDALVNAQSINVDPAIPNVTPTGDSDTEPGLADLNIDRQINEKGQQLLTAWKVLRVVFVLALIIIAFLGVLEYVLYRRRKQSEVGDSK